MRSVPRFRVAAVLIVAAAVVVACGSEEELDVVEGEPVELGELLYNVQITRFLNPSDPEDRAYLRGQPAPSANEEYLAVFMTIENEGSSTATVPEEFTILDTRDNSYRSLDSDSVYALRPGAPLDPGEEVPSPDTPAASGPIKGAMVLFLVDRTVTENRPIELEIPSGAGERARVELDI
jgi:hypothetical protein